MWHLLSLPHFSLTRGQKRPLKCNAQPLATSLPGKGESGLHGLQSSQRKVEMISSSAADQVGQNGPGMTTLSFLQALALRWALKQQNGESPGHLRTSKFPTLSQQVPKARVLPVDPQDNLKPLSSSRWTITIMWMLCSTSGLEWKLRKHLLSPPNLLAML